MSLKRHFTEHPHSVDETYLEHLKVAAHFAGNLAIAAGAAAIHAVVPSLCTTTASKKIGQLHAEMNSGRRRPFASIDAAA